MKRFCYWIALLLLPTFVFAQEQMLKPELRKLDAVARNVSSGMPLSNRALVDRPGQGKFLSSYIRTTLSRPELEAMGAIVGTQLGNGLFTAQIPVDAIAKFAAMPEVSLIQGARPMKVYLDASLPETGGDDLHNGIPPAYSGFTGRGVVVGDVDTGIDRLHQDFRKADGTTRIRYIWDQTVTGTPPSGFSYGTEWDSVAINGGSATETDTQGHGSHTAGIAAGNGRATGNGYPQYTYVGEAPEANIVAVKTTFYDTAITDGVNYVFQKAAALGMPAVVNLSLGGQYGPHDGTDPFDVGVSALTGAGKIVCASAGNEGDSKIHGERTIGASATDSLTFTISSYTPYGGANNDYVDVDGWYGGSDGFTVTVKSPRGYTAGPYVVGTSGTVSTIDGSIYIENGISTPSNGDREFFIEIWDATTSSYPRAGTWTIRLKRTANVESGLVDAWLAGYQLGSAGYPYFVRGLTYAKEIGSPGTADSVITVAAYTTKACWLSINGSNYCWSPSPTVGAIASFSSHGPRRDGVLKPDITAPGFGVMSALSAQSTVSQPYIAPDGVHTIMAGTSMSCPHVTGAVGSLLQKFPSFTPSSMKSWLFPRTRTDSYTGTVPNTTWGYGKLDVSDRVAPQVTVLRPNGGESFTAAAVETIKWVASDDLFGVASVSIYYSTNGGATYPNLVATGLPNSSNYAWTVPAVASDSCRVRVVAVDSSPAANTGFDTTDGLFRIGVPDTTPPVVLVISPNGGENWTVGTQDSIKWNATDFSGVDSVSIFYSVNGGASYPFMIAHGIPNSLSYLWTIPNTPSDSCKVKVVAYDAAPAINSAFDVTDNLFSIKSAVGIAVSQFGSVPSVFFLAQNNPNPFNPETGISFGLPVETRISLKVYSVAGKLVRSIAEGRLNAGTYHRRWDGRDESGKAAPSGIYFLRLEAEGFVQTKKMVMLK